MLKLLLLYCSLLFFHDSPFKSDNKAQFSSTAENPSDLYQTSLFSPASCHTTTLYVHCMSIAQSAATVFHEWIYNYCSTNSNLYSWHILDVMHVICVFSSVFQFLFCRKYVILHSFWGDLVSKGVQTFHILFQVFFFFNI